MAEHKDARLFETLKTVTAYPRFSITVNGESARVTRCGSEGGKTYFEIDDVDMCRETFPTDYGYVESGVVFMRHQEWNEEMGDWTTTGWENIGALETSSLRVGDHLSVDQGSGSPYRG